MCKRVFFGKMLNKNTFLSEYALLREFNTYYIDRHIEKISDFSNCQVSNFDLPKNVFLNLDSKIETINKVLGNLLKVDGFDKTFDRNIARKSDYYIVRIIDTYTGPKYFYTIVNNLTNTQIHFNKSKLGWRVSVEQYPIEHGSYKEVTENEYNSILENKSFLFFKEYINLVLFFIKMNDIIFCNKTLWYNLPK